ncbi:SAV_915 family protein [Prauserella oleivorans]|uniref:SAV_915 family protein n=1 Tax=Prauserella oleivorans TaxID=1478153 RepID=A0ABW5WAP8_9PSEU
MTDDDKPSPPELPPVLYLPCLEHVEAPEDAVIEYVRTDRGHVALVGYSSLDQLKARCGDDRPWLRCPTEMVGRIREAAPFDAVLIDVAMPPGLRRDTNRSVDSGQEADRDPL